ncbi:MAG TPA: phosphatase PAP2 family protein [Gemmatimonadaceae bacterium]|nr:phosphatase PAP2 family protein [Gemmatimonadaceae bacterium]
MAASRVYAALAVAQYRAVNRIDDADSDGAMPQHGVGAGGRAALEARRGAVAGASAAVLSFLFSTRTTDFEQRVTMEANATPGNVHPQFALGLAIGRAAGAELVERLKTDRFTTPWTGTVPVGPGMWVANGTPAGATFGSVQPYFMTSGDQFRPGAPPAFQATAFLADLAEVKDFTSNLTDAQRATALYWNLPTGTHTPVGYWNEVAAQYIAELGLNEQAATRVFALTNAAMMDALIGCWEAKYYYWTLRPSQADNQIALAFALPNHPSYPSGHSCVSQSAATVLGQLFPAKAAEVNAWVADAGLSRMYAGIHYRFDITAGQDIGRAAGMLAIAREASLMQ